MTRTASLLAVLALFCVGGDVPAGEGCSKSLKGQLCCARCATMPCGCPDDYCRKPMPRIPCLPRCGCADDYCRKPMPCLCWPVDRQFYRCAPPECGRR
jgi:hypothetical protein